MTIQSFLTDLCEHCGMDTSHIAISVDESDDAVAVQLDIPESDSGLFIGYHGESLDSLQRLLRIIFQESLPDKKLRLNVNQYRDQREEKLRAMAQHGAEKVLETGTPYTFSLYIPSHERFVIHSELSGNPDFSDLESISDGEGKERRLTIRFKQGK